MIKILYSLDKSEICLIQSILCQVDSLYNDIVAEKLRELLLKIISSGTIEENQIKKLIELLPQFEVQEQNKTGVVKTDEEFYSEWPDWENASEEQWRRKILFFLHQLTNWLFIQNAVYQKQIQNRKYSGLCKKVSTTVAEERNH